MFWCSVPDLRAPVQCGFACKSMRVHTYTLCLGPVADIREELISRKAVDVLCCVQAEHAARKVCLLQPHLLKIVVETIPCN